jgi:hypothetical protein
MRVKFNPPRDYWIKKFKKDTETRNDFTEYCELLYSRMEKTTTSNEETSSKDNYQR